MDMKIKTLLLAFVSCFGMLDGYAQNGYELSAGERATIEQRVIEKIDDFLSYLPDIAAKSNKSKEEKQLALKYIDETLELFIGEGNEYQYKDQAGNWRWHEAVKMQTTSRGRISRTQPMKQYLRRLMALPYHTVEIDTCAAVRINKNLHPIGDGRYIGSAYFIQAFRATRDRRLVVNDRDAKQVTIYVESELVDGPTGPEIVWIIKLGDVRVITDWNDNYYYNQ